MTVCVRLIMSVGLCFFVASEATAGPIVFSDTFDPTDVFFSQNGSTACHGTNGISDTVTATTDCVSLDWSHSLLTMGFTPATDTLTNASLLLTFYDDADSPDETYNLTLDLLSFSNNTVTSDTTSGVPFQISYDVLTQMPDGVLNALLTNAQNGNHDFYFASAVLTAEGNRSTFVAADTPTVVPEPATMVLVGSFLGAFAYRRMRKSRA